MKTHTPPPAWPENWPALSALAMVLRSNPEGCRRGDFAELDTNRPRGQTAVLGMGWINIRRRLIAEGVARIGSEGKLFFCGPSESDQPEAEPAPDFAELLPTDIEDAVDADSWIVAARLELSPAAAADLGKLLGILRGVTIVVQDGCAPRFFAAPSPVSETVIHTQPTAESDELPE